MLTWRSKWEGTLTTVDNPWFGVRGGAKVKVLVIFANWKDGTIFPDNEIVSYFEAINEKAEVLRPAVSTALRNFLSPTERSPTSTL